MIPSICKTWAPIGCTPIARHRARHWRKVSVIGVLSISPKRHRLGCYLATHCDCAIRQPQIIDFLRHLMRHLRGAMIIVWDNLNAHRGRQLRDWLAEHPRVDVEYLPPYAPELNPVEGMWNHGKNHYLANHCIDDVFELADRIHTHGAHLDTRPNLLCGFLRQTRLPLRPHRRIMNYQRSA